MKLGKRFNLFDIEHVVFGHMMKPKDVLFFFDTVQKSAFEVPWDFSTRCRVSAGMCL